MFPRKKTGKRQKNATTGGFLGQNRLGSVLTGNRFSVFHFTKNQNWPLIGQRKITPPKSKRRYFVGPIEKKSLGTSFHPNQNQKRILPQTRTPCFDFLFGFKVPSDFFSMGPTICFEKKERLLKFGGVILRWPIRGQFWSLMKWKTENLFPVNTDP